ncbi:MAG: glycosyltransferase family 39 protein [Myxococcales bacterium]|nr:glycosyltransferase family 39 protein [Myxococcales bacterium]
MSEQPSAWARPWGPAALAVLVAFAVGTLALRRTSTITDDWQGWRQADTQAMARSQAFEEFSPWSPRIDWRGDGAGYVEAEMPIYPALLAPALALLGDSVWPGQLLSLTCVLAAAALLFRALALRFGGAPALVALVAVLLGQGAIVIAPSIQPDTLAFLAFTVAWLAFLRFLAHGRWRDLALWVGATAIAGLVKPTTLELGLAQGLLVLLAHRHALRQLRLWLGWLVVLAAVAAYLWHARQLYLTHGNTFGVLSGGDSKLPALSRLLEPRSWFDLGRYAVAWGVTWPGLIAAIFLVVRRRLDAESVALGVAAAALCVLAFRYTSGPFGTHYHLPHAVLGAHLVARAIAEAKAGSRALGAAAIAVACAAALFGGLRAVKFVRRLPPQPETALGEDLVRFAPPGTLIAVRARAESYNVEWQTVNNYEDPRIFYLSRTRGWVLPNDLKGPKGPARLAELAARGARFYVHVLQYEPDADLRDYLATSAQLVSSSPAGLIYALRVK